MKKNAAEEIRVKAAGGKVYTLQGMRRTWHMAHGA